MTDPDRGYYEGDVREYTQELMEQCQYDMELASLVIAKTHLEADFGSSEGQLLPWQQTTLGIVVRAIEERRGFLAEGGRMDPWSRGQFFLAIARNERPLPHLPVKDGSEGDKGQDLI